MSLPLNNEPNVSPLSCVLCQNTCFVQEIYARAERQQAIRKGCNQSTLGTDHVLQIDQKCSSSFLLLRAGLSKLILAYTFRNKQDDELGILDASKKIFPNVAKPFLYLSY